MAEDRALRKMPTTMEDWAKRLDMFLELEVCAYLPIGKFYRTAARSPQKSPRILLKVNLKNIALFRIGYLFQTSIK